MIRHRAKVFLVVGFTAGLLIGLLLWPRAEAESRTPPLPSSSCRIYAVIDALVTGKRGAAEFRRDLARCAAAVRISRATDRCLDVEGSRMGRGVCDALARAGDRRGTIAWAWSPDLHELLRRESTWNPNAINDTSGACGLFQRLQMHPAPPCPWPSSGRGTSRERVHATPLVQSVDGLRYIAGRYGTPAAALVHHDAVGWY